MIHTLTLSQPTARIALHGLQWDRDISIGERVLVECDGWLVAGEVVAGLTMTPTIVCDAEIGPGRCVVRRPRSQALAEAHAS